MRTTILITLLLLAPLQPVSGIQGGTRQINEGPRLYIDWTGMDWDYVRREIRFVNFVRSQPDAEIVLLVTTQTAGNSASTYTLSWSGQGQFAGITDTLTHTPLPGTSVQTLRRDLVRKIKIGLTRYLARTPLCDRIGITVKPATPGQRPSGLIRDPWDAWVFKLYGSAYLSGEKLSTYRSLYSSFTASRVTPAWKLTLFGSLGHVRSTWFTDPDWVISETRSRYASALSVWSLNDHWSAGTLLSATYSTYQNLDLATAGAGALEYNLFPYRKASRYQWRFLYYLGIKYHDYHIETLYNRMTEWLPYQTLSSSLVIKDPWGRIVLTLSGSNYLQDLSKYRVGVYLEFALKLIAGLSLETYASYTRIRDQVALPAGEATEEEILLRRRELSTGYSYWISIGLSYTFGSIYNNVVNPRFGN